MAWDPINSIGPNWNKSTLNLIDQVYCYCTLSFMMIELGEITLPYVS